MTPRICHVHVFNMRLKFIVTPFRIEFGLVQNRPYQNFNPFRVAKKNSAMVMVKILIDIFTPPRVLYEMLIILGKKSL